jgi:FkbM family methyltransferase
MGIQIRPGAALTDQRGDLAHTVFRAAILAALILALGGYLAPAHFQADPAPAKAGAGSPRLLKTDTAAGLELWQTGLGQLWIPKPGYYVIRHLEWEGTVEKVYDHPLVHVQRGDVVIDCGAHIGGFTRLALQAGARLVVAIEPEPSNLLAFRRNIELELKSSRVMLIPKGVWETTGKLSLHLSNTGDSHSVIFAQKGPGDEVIEVTTLDTLATELALDKVDFIKMDIEGSEANALRGARQVIERWKPRMAISSYHVKGDPATLCALVWSTRPDYLVTTKDLIAAPHGATVPKVLFFY